MARRAQRQKSSSYIILAVLGVAALLAVVGGVYIFSSSEPFRPYTMRVKEEPEKSVSDDLDEVVLPDPADVPRHLPPDQRAYMLLHKARKDICVNDLQKALSLCEEALETCPVYAGDVYFSMGMCHTEHAIRNELPYARRNEAGRKKIELYRRAMQAYRQPGAKTGWAQSTEKRIETIKISIKMEENMTKWRQGQIEAGIMAPPKGRRRAP